MDHALKSYNALLAEHTMTIRRRASRQKDAARTLQRTFSSLLETR
jgi:hypothetical protein